MAVANTLAYYATATIIAVKSFIVQASVYDIRTLAPRTFPQRNNPKRKIPEFFRDFRLGEGERD
jgi:hypothetical protein